MQFKDKEKSKNRITHIIVAIIILLLYVFMFIPTDLIVKPTLPKNALDNITVTNIDRISGTTTFTNKTGDKLEYTHYTDKQANANSQSKNARVNSCVISYKKNKEVKNYEKNLD